jgi:hypothetical protein
MSKPSRSSALHRGRLEETTQETKDETEDRYRVRVCGCTRTASSGSEKKSMITL